MIDLNALVVFAAVAEAQSFSEAARRLAMPISTVSRKVAELEDKLGIRLLERSTRRLRLTDVGNDILDHARQSADVNAAVEALIDDRQTTVTGTLRLTCPPNISDSLITPLIAGFQKIHPDVTVHLLVTERMVDHIADGVDLAVRVGRLADSRLVARRLLRYRHRLLASPDYLKEHGTPVRPADLAGHRLIAFLRQPGEGVWRFEQGDKRETVTFRPGLAMNDYAALAKALCAGCGIGELPPVVAPSLARFDDLVEVIPDWRFPQTDLSLVHLGQRNMPRAHRLFRDFAVARTPALLPDMPGAFDGSGDRVG